MEPLDVLTGLGVFDFVGTHECPVHHGDHTSCGGAVELAEGVELFQVARVETGGFAEGARSHCFQCLILG